METHNEPTKALSDSNTVLDIKYLENILYQAKEIHKIRVELYNKLGKDKVHLPN